MPELMALVNPPTADMKVCDRVCVQFDDGDPASILRFSAMCEPDQIETHSLLWRHKEMGGGFRAVPGGADLGQVEFGFGD